jgi:hypothetical protein
MITFIHLAQHHAQVHSALRVPPTVKRENR